MYRDLKLSDRARVIEMAVKSGITDLDTIEQVYNTFAEGGDLGNGNSEGKETTERRKVGDHYLTLEQYKEQQRDTIRQAAIQKALTRTRGVAPVINGVPGSSCIYTFTDNYGRKYQVAGTQSFAANPEKYGFEVAGPITEGMEGNMYLQINDWGVPYHATMITGYDDSGKPLLTYSSGHAAGGSPISRERWSNPDETYEHYLERYNRTNSPEADYKKNQPVWSSPSYETYRFIGTPDDNTKWQAEWEAGDPALRAVVPSEALNNRVVLYKEGGLKKRETAYARKYREEQEAKAKRAKEHPTLNNAFRNDTTDSGESYYDIVRSRYDSAMRAMQRRGFTYEDASRLAPMIVTQNVLEGGWKMSRPDNNFGGMQTNGKFLTFDSPDEFYDAYLDMLDEKWGQSKVVANNWRNAQNLDDWARILNHEDLRLWSKERYDDYTAKHPETQIYLYAPEWENGYKPYRAHLRGVEPRVNTYLDMVLEENPYTEEMYSAPIEPTASQNDNFNLSMNQFQDLLESNKSKGHMAKGGRLFEEGGDTDDDGNTVRLPWWQRMIQGATMAEAPAVMTAAGMEISPDGTITYGNDNEGVRRLRNNLAVIGAAGAAGAAFPGAINWLSNPANQIIAGKIAMPLLGGATTNEAVRQYTPWNGWGDMLVRGTGLDEVMDYALLPREQQDFAYAGAEMTNPLFYAPYGKFGELGASAIGRAERGVGRFTDSARKYVEGVKDRLAESVIRMADTVKDEPLAATRQIFSPNGLRYILDPKASHLAYELPYKYSGADYLAGDAHAGDLVDQWIGKSPVEGGVYDYNKGIVPEGMMDAIKRLYPNKVDKIPLVQFETKPSEFFGEVPSYELGVRRSAMSGSVQDASGRSIVDPGRYGSYLRQAEDGSYYFDNWDLWKFHPESQRPNGLKRLFYKPAKFVDDRGTPILFNWKTPVKINAAPEAEASTDWYWSGMNHGDFDDYINFGILDKVPGDYYVDVPYNEPFLKNGGKIHIKPENRGKFTALKERTGHSASWFKEHGTPSQKKMATFALNARKWKHSDGGLMTKL